MNTTELTLEMIAPYLPYGLKGYAGERERIDTLLGVYGTGGHHLTMCCRVNNHNTVDYSISIGDFKPILRPISWLKTDEGFDKYMELMEELEMVNCENLVDAMQSQRYYAIDIQKYKILEKWMNSNHYDWKFNLIESGLALDSTTI